MWPVKMLPPVYATALLQVLQAKSTEGHARGGHDPEILKELRKTQVAASTYFLPTNRSTDNAISQVLHSSLTHIDSKNGNHVRLLFIFYSSAFNKIVPIKLADKLIDLGLNSSLCDWIQDFLTGRP